MNGFDIAGWGTALPATGYTCVTRKNRRNDPDRMVLRTYDPVVGRHVGFREER
ncbi:50S ribosomal protein L33 [Streptomyces sp. NPDC054765]